LTDPVGGLRWPIRRSFLGYVAGMADGGWEVTGGATVVPDGAFRFPWRTAHEGAAAEGAGLPVRAAFAGEVDVSGHQGLLRLRIGDPAVEHDGSHGRLTIADPDWPGRRMTLATCDLSPLATPGAGCTGIRVRLTADGADLFNRAYDEGDELDDFTITTSAYETPAS
jgi:hypothetical protein